MILKFVFHMHLNPSYNHRNLLLLKSKYLVKLNNFDHLIHFFCIGKPKMQILFFNFEHQKDKMTKKILQNHHQIVNSFYELCLV